MNNELDALSKVTPEELARSVAKASGTLIGIEVDCKIKTIDFSNPRSVDINIQIEEVCEAPF